MAINYETVLEVKHYTVDLFYFKTTRNAATRFRDGEFTMMGLLDNDKPLLRAYSIASPNHAEYMEFYSIKVQDGPLTSKLQHIVAGDKVIVNTKTVGTLVIDNITPGRNLYFLATGTGIAPFMSLIRGLETYDNYDNVILVWGTRYERELAFKDYLAGLNDDEVYGELTQGKFKMYTTVTREPYENQTRVTTAMEQGLVQSKLGLPALDPAHDRVMICGSIPMNNDIVEYLEAVGFTEGNNKAPGSYVVERAFVG